MIFNGDNLALLHKPETGETISVLTISEIESHFQILHVNSHLIVRERELDCSNQSVAFYEAINMCKSYHYSICIETYCRRHNYILR